MTDSIYGDEGTHAGHSGAHARNSGDEQSPNPGEGVPAGLYMQKRFLSAISSFKTPEPLNDDNWVSWKGQIWPMLELNEVWTHCEGPSIAPPPDNEHRKEWDTAEWVAHILISNNLSGPQFVHVTQATTIKQMWENLKSVHEHKGKQSITALRRTLYQTWAKDGDNIIAHLTKMCQLQGQLHLMGSHVPDEDFTNWLVSSLPQSWDLFTTSYLGSQTGEKALTSQQFIAIIRNEYNWRKAATGDVETVTTEAALVSSSKCVAKKRKAVESSSNEKKKDCHTCG